MEGFSENAVPSWLQVASLSRDVGPGLRHPCVRHSSSLGTPGSTRMFFVDWPTQSMDLSNSSERL